MSHDDAWNPEDGEAPTEAELAEARALAEALDSRSRAALPEVNALLDTALRVTATAHPDAEAAKAVAARAVEAATRTTPATVFTRPRLRLVAAAAALLLTASGTAGLSRWNALHTRHLITHDASDVLTTAVESGAGSVPSTRIYERRMHAYRDGLLAGRRR